MINVYESLAGVQQELKATKDLFNKFGGYNYRSCESILESVKPLLAKHNLALTLTDEMVQVGERIYVKATATVYPIDYDANMQITADSITAISGKSVSVSAYAREEEAKKGMDSSQVTGAASSYARKYALNGLFCIDDNKDSDATNTHGKDESPPKQDKPKATPKSDKPKAESKTGPEQPKEQSEEETNAMFYPTADSMIQNQGGVEYAICSKCGGYIYQVRKKDGSVISVRDMIVLGLRGFNQALCKNCYSEAVKAARAK